MNVIAASVLLSATGFVSLSRLKARIELSRAKHRSLAGHPRTARRFAKVLPFYEYRDDEFFGCDGADPELVGQRRQAWTRLANEYGKRFGKSAQASSELESGISDMQFISHYRVPFQFRGLVKDQLISGSIMKATSGATVTDLDDNTFYDLTGSFGVNVFGNDLYKAWIAEGCRLAQELGPVLGAYHPTIAYNVLRLKEISQQDEVSFHMSGTEAVMQAVRLARYHSGRTHLVRFCGSYHGWWGEVQPGVGNPSKAFETYNLKEMHARSLHVLRTRRDIACVLVNPLQALHPNSNAPGDSALVDSSRRASFDRQAYTTWLQELREVCTERGIVLIFDEVFVGFRIALGGAQEYFGVQADLVTYGKTVGGGLPIGVLCGRAQWMRRFRDDAPADICFARGTFNSHPYVMGAMTCFLKHIAQAEVHALYKQQDELWDGRAARLNHALEQQNIPVQVANFCSIWTVYYTEPSRYNWMFQFYLRLEGLALSWVGTGRLIFCLTTSDQDFAEIEKRFIKAALSMVREGWWQTGLTLSNQGIRRTILRESLRARLARLAPPKLQWTKVNPATPSVVREVR